MRRQAQHDEICVGSVETVVGVRVMVWLTSLTTNEVHDLVLPLTRDVGIGQNHLGIKGTNNSHTCTCSSEMGEVRLKYIYNHYPAL